MQHIFSCTGSAGGPPVTFRCLSIGPSRLETGRRCKGPIGKHSHAIQKSGAAFGFAIARAFHLREPQSFKVVVMPSY